MTVAALELGNARISDLDTGPAARFRFRRRLPGAEPSDAEDARLVESVGRFGVLQPPVLAETGRGLEIVSGYRRIAAGQAAGLGESPALIARGPGAETGSLIRVWLECATHGRPLSELERMTLAAGVSSMSAGDLDRFLPALSIVFERRMTSGLVSKIRLLTGLGDSVLEAVHQGRISTGDLLQLEGHPGIDTAAAAGLIAGAGLSRSARRRVIRDMLSIADSGHGALASFISGAPSSGMPLEEAAETALRPRMRKDLLDAASAIDGMGLPSGVSVRLPESMEGGSCGIEIDFRREEELGLAIEKLREGMEKGAVARVLGILRGKTDDR